MATPAMPSSRSHRKRGSPVSDKARAMCLTPSRTLSNVSTSDFFSSLLAARPVSVEDDTLFRRPPPEEDIGPSAATSQFAGVTVGGCNDRDLE